MDRKILIKKDGVECIVSEKHYFTVMKIMSKDICKYYLPICGDCGNHNQKFVGRDCIGPDCQYKKPRKRRG